MIIYNAFPLAYQDIDQIAAQLPDIKRMGFQIVWLNPIQNSRRTLSYPGGSLYSMTHDRLFLGQWAGGDVEVNERALEKLKDQAIESKMVLMFDLVMKQVGNTLPKTDANRHLFLNAYKGEFDYSSVEKQKAIFEIFFKPLIERYVVKYGFTGMRIDAAGQVPIDIQMMAIAYFRELTQQHYQRMGIVLGEFLEDNQKLAPFIERGITYDLITNSSYWTVNPSPYFDPNKRAAHNLDMCERKQIAPSGTIGWTGNHDMKTLYETCYENLPKHFPLSVAQEKAMLKKMMQERIATMAFINDGGYYLLCGDEFGSSQRRNCFEWEGWELEPALRSGQTFHENWGGKYDLRDFIRQVNHIRNRLSDEVSPHFWSEQYVLNTRLDPNHDVKCVVRNNGGGFTGSMDIIFVNVDPNEENNFIIDSRFIDDIKSQIKTCHPEFDMNKRDIHIHMVGRLTVSEWLPYHCRQSKMILEEQVLPNNDQHVRYCALT